MTHKLILLFGAMAFALSSCDVTPATPEIPTPAFVTATLPATAIPASTPTALPPTVAPTIAPISGTTTTQVNVRADTSTASESLGTLPAFSSVQIIGRDASGNWLQVIFNEGTGWVRADLIQRDVAAEIPVTGGETGNGSGARGVVLRGVNVRNGPGTDFGSLGLLSPNDVVSILGKDSSGEWMKIEYPAAPDGSGWVAAEFLQVENADALPTLDEQAEEPPPNADPEPVEAPSSIPTARAAQPDSDSANAPLATFELSTTAARTVVFQGEVSSPDGDPEDWLAFSAQGTDVVIQVLCESGSIQVELFGMDGASSALDAGCSRISKLRVIPNSQYRLRVSPTPAEERVYLKYELKIKLGE